MTNEEFIESIKLEGEEFRPVVGWEDFYMVSSLGRVAYVNTNIFYKNRKKPRKVKQHLVKLQKSRYGNNLFYNTLVLYRNGEHKSVKVHWLVADAFIPNENNYPCIDHIDTDGTNNVLSNLRRCTYRMNTMNPITRSRNKLVQNNHLGYRSKKVVFVDKNDVVYEFKSIKKAAEYCNVNKNTVSKSCSKKTSFSKKGRWYFLSDYKTLMSSNNAKELSQMQSKN